MHCHKLLAQGVNRQHISLIFPQDRLTGIDSETFGVIVCQYHIHLTPGKIAHSQHLYSLTMAIFILFTIDN